LPADVGRPSAARPQVRRPGQDARSRAAWAVAALALTALWFLSRPYLGIVNDAQVYVGRAVADLDPTGVGRELDFAHDGQSSFTLFRPAAAALTAALGPGAAAEALTALGLAAWLAAAAALFAQVLRDARLGARRGALLAATLLALAWLPADYGQLGVFHFAESFASARLWAEAVCMAALAAALIAERSEGRRRALTQAAALCLSLVAAAIHPIMALPAIGTVWALIAWRDPRWLAAPVLAGIALVAAGLAGAPVASRLFQTLDPAWRAATAERTPVVFPLMWPATSWAWICCQMVTLFLAARALDGPSRRLAIAAAGLGLAGLALALAWPNLLVVQLQPWRTLWLAAALATGSLPLLGAALWRQGGAGRSVLAALALAWVLRDVVAATLACTGLAAGLSAWPARRAFPRLAWVAAVALAAGMAALVLALRMRAALEDFGRVTTGPGEALAFAAHTGVLVPLALAIALTIAIGPPAALRGPARIGPVAAALLLSIGAVALWDARAPFLRAVEDGRARMGADQIAPGASVYWHGGFGAEWLITGRPDWWGRWQGAGMVFDRRQALAWERRRHLTAAAGLAPTLYSPSEGWPSPMTLAAARSLCDARGGPDVLVAPTALVGDPRLLALSSRWRPPTPQLTPSPDRRRLISISDYAVIACAAIRAPGVDVGRSTQSGPGIGQAGNPAC
jgi:hypothetical protein